MLQVVRKGIFKFLLMAGRVLIIRNWKSSVILTIREWVAESTYIVSMEELVCMELQPAKTILSLGKYGLHGGVFMILPNYCLLLNIQYGYLFLFEHYSWSTPSVKCFFFSSFLFPPYFFLFFFFFLYYGI